MDIKVFLQRFPLVKHLLLMVAVSVAIFVAVYLFLMHYGRHGEEFAVPELVGKNVDELDEFPQSKLLEYIIIDSVYVPNREGGEVLSQNPIAHEKVKAGRKVYMIICAYNPEKITVPDVIDMTVRRAISELGAVELQGGKLTFVENEYKNAVLEMYYKGRPVDDKTQVPKGSEIDFTVGLGENPDEAVTLTPFVLGKSPKEARRDILPASMNVGVEHYDADIDPRYARVSRQEPNYNGITRLPLGAKVELWYSSDRSTDFDKLVKDFKVDTTGAAASGVPVYGSDGDDELLIEEGDGGLLSW